ncbi:MAG: TIGR00730 family Rossman fold protein [Woeseiaceae bacterium]|nr:TIGR00730 family Rossman fold protein [Woeseiaceae bacterium]
MNRLCVYCGSSAGGRDVYVTAARELGALLAQRKIGLVYGGSCIGVMGALADAVLEAGGEVTGIIPQALRDKEIAHSGLSELQVVDSMHERKSRMATLSDGFIALPGGFGTLEEIIEVLTWGQLGFHDKPCGLLNVEGYFDGLLAFLDHAESEGFVHTLHRRMLLDAVTPATLLGKFADYAPPTVEKWRPEAD